MKSYVSYLRSVFFPNIGDRAEKTAGKTAGAPFFKHCKGCSGTFCRAPGSQERKDKNLDVN